MKNQSIILSFLLVSVFALTSCDKDSMCLRGEGGIETRELNLASFDKVRLMGFGRVYLRQDSIQRVTVESHPNIIDAIKTNVSGGKWKIDFRNNCVKNVDVFNVYISMPVLKEAGVSGSGEILGQNTFNTGDLELEISGSGNIDLRAIAANVNSNISGSGNIQLSGGAAKHEICISGSGDVKAFELPCDNSNVKISGSGTSRVKVGKKLDVEISGSGDVYYKGFPGINSSVSGSGKIIDSN
jgi:hypothetical protein